MAQILARKLAPVSARVIFKVYSLNCHPGKLRPSESVLSFEVRPDFDFSAMNSFYVTRPNGNTFDRFALMGKCSSVVSSQHVLRVQRSWDILYNINMDTL